MSDLDHSLRMQLVETDEEFRRLHDEHQSFERRLEELQLKSTLSEADEVEAKSIKRQKLWLKDRMEVILRSQRELQTPV